MNGMITLIAFALAIGFALGVPATLCARALGRRLNAMDGLGVVGQVKAPPRRVPNTGGVGIVLAFAIPLAAVLATVWLAPGFISDPPGVLAALKPYAAGLAREAPSAAWLLGAVLVLHVLGLIDDRRPLPALPKLLIILTVTTTAVVATDSRLLTLLDGFAGGTWLSVLLTVLYVAVITNAFNFLDNMDGLSGGVGVVCAVFFLAACLTGPTPQWFVGGALALLAGAVLGFLVFNFPFTARKRLADGLNVGGASVFMGDGGSLVLGFLLGLLSVRITYVASGVSGPHWGALLTPVVILAIPLYDFTSVCVIRISQGKSPLVGDLQHFSHRLVRHGLSPRAAVLVIYGCAAVTGIGGVSLSSLAPWQSVLVGVQTLLVLAVIAAYEWSSRSTDTEHAR